MTSKIKQKHPASRSTTSTTTSHVDDGEQIGERSNVDIVEETSSLNENRNVDDTDDTELRDLQNAEISNECTHLATDGDPSRGKGSDLPNETIEDIVLANIDFPSEMQGLFERVKTWCQKNARSLFEQVGSNHLLNLIPYFH